MLAIFDPVLLVYEPDSLSTHDPVALNRMTTLSLHEEFRAEFAIQWAVTYELASDLLGRFPYSALPDHPEFHDLQLLLTDGLSRATVINPGDGDPVGWVCALTPDQTQACFRDSLAGVRGLGMEDGVLVLTWEGCREHAEGALERERLAWDEESWFRGLANEVWWPDVTKAVRVRFWSDPGMRSHKSATEEPIAFSCTDAFVEAVPPDRIEDVVKALAKRVHGILDSALGDESMDGFRRMRATLFWRIHYREGPSGIVFYEFGPHDIGGV